MIEHQALYSRQYRDACQDQKQSEQILCPGKRGPHKRMLPSSPQLYEPATVAIRKATNNILVAVAQILLVIKKLCYFDPPDSCIFSITWSMLKLAGF